MLVEDFEKGLIHPVPKEKIVKLKNIPFGLQAINEEYGVPYSNKDMSKYNKDFQKNLVGVDLPYPMRLSWNKDTKVNRVLAHEKIGPSLVDALQEVLSNYSYDKIVEKEWDLFGGIFNFRTIRGNERKISTHSWGIAIDLNPHLGPLGEDPKNYPDIFVYVFKKRGWIWGGEFDRPDGMHFQACDGY